MERDRWQRWSPLTGIAFAVLFLAALGVSGSGPGDTPVEVTQWYADDGNRGAAFFVFFLIVGAALCLLWFLGALRGVLVRAEGDPARWTALGFGAGVVSATLLLTAASLYVTPAATAGQEEFPFDAATANAFANAGFAALVCSAMAGALLDGFIVAPLLLFSIFFLPLFVWLAWVLAISLVLIVRTARVAGWRGAST